MSGAFLSPPAGGNSSLLAWRLVVAIRAVDFGAEYFFRVRDFGNVIMAVVAGPHIMVFSEESTCRVMHLRPVRVLWWSPFGIFMAFQASFVVTQIFGDYRAAQAQCQNSQNSGD